MITLYHIYKNTVYKIQIKQKLEYLANFNIPYSKGTSDEFKIIFNKHNKF